MPQGSTPVKLIVGGFLGLGAAVLGGGVVGYLMRGKGAPDAPRHIAGPPSPAPPIVPPDHVIARWEHEAAWCRWARVFLDAGDALGTYARNPTYRAINAVNAHISDQDIRDVTDWLADIGILVKRANQSPVLADGLSVGVAKRRLRVFAGAGAKPAHFPIAGAPQNVKMPDISRPTNQPTNASSAQPTAAMASQVRVNAWLVIDAEE